VFSLKYLLEVIQLGLKIVGE